MSFTLAGLIAAAAPVVLEAISDFARANRGTFHAFVKQSKPAIQDMSKKMDNELNKYENDGWEEDKEG